MIEINASLRRIMDEPSFPCHRVAVDEGDPVAHFLKHRPNSNWVFLGDHALQSSIQAWTAWTQARRNEFRGTSVARSLDAEFMRYLSGTHHVSEAFQRAGYLKGSGFGWVVQLPDAEHSTNTYEIEQPMPLINEDFESTVHELIEHLGWTKSTSAMHYSIEGMKRLGISVEDWMGPVQDDALIAHIIMADDQSSSHR